MLLSSVVKPNTYQDSVGLMALSARLQELPGVEVASVMMGTAANKALFREAGLLTPEIEAAGPGDLCIALKAGRQEAVQAGLEQAEAFLQNQAQHREGGRGRPVARSLEGALSLLPTANLALISVPGPYAAEEARKALERELHVLLFSDNVPHQDEVALKREAERRGVLLMGPDCGTAIVDGVVLGFANRVPRGPVGLVGASGTGLQEVSCLLAHLGSGISHALGTGSHDLSADVGGSTTRIALRALMADERTRVVVWVSKPGAPEVTESLLDQFAQPPKPLIAMLLELPDRASYQARYPGVRFAETLEQAALWAAQALGVGAADGWEDDLHEMAQRVKDLRPEQHAVRGVFAGGTLAAEAATVLGPVISGGDRAGRAQSRHGGLPLPGDEGLRTVPGAVLASGPHLIVDYGDDTYTRGRAHPMIDPRVRQEALRAAGQDERVGVVLFDLVLGYGAHEDPAGALAPAIEAAQQAARRRSGSLVCIGYVCGTEQDPQSYQAQRAKLERAGVLVARSNAQAARYAAAALEMLRER